MPRNLEQELKDVEQIGKEAKERALLLQEFASYEGEDRVVSIEEISKHLESQPKDNFKALSGIPALDDIIGGFRPGNLITISAPTKNGKTTLCQTFTTGFSDNGIRSLWFSFEVPYQEFVDAFPKDKLPITFLPLRLRKDPKRKLEWIETRILEAIAKYDIKIVFIDHLHYILGLDDISENVSFLVGAIMRELKRIAVENGIIIFLVAHTKKALQYEVPTTEDIRDSSFISQESDIVLMMWRLRDKKTKEYLPEARLAVREHRRTGQVGTIGLLHSMINKQFYEKAYQPNDSE